MKKTTSKKRIFILLMTIAIMSSIITGCSLFNAGTAKETLESSGFDFIQGLETNSNKPSIVSLYYFKDTGIVYISACGNMTSGLTPYISAEGTYVKYVNGNLENVE